MFYPLPPCNVLGSTGLDFDFVVNITGLIMTIWVIAVSKLSHWKKAMHRELYRITLSVENAGLVSPLNSPNKIFNEELDHQSIWAEKLHEIFHHDQEREIFFLFLISLQKFHFRPIHGWQDRQSFLSNLEFSDFNDVFYDKETFFRWWSLVYYYDYLSLLSFTQSIKALAK